MVALGGERPTGGTVPAAAVADVHGAVAALGVLPPVIVLGRDVRRNAAEERVGEALTAALCADPVVRDAFVAARTQAQGQGRPLVVGIRAEDPAVRALPWELLAEAPQDALGLARVGRGLVVRAVAAPVAAGPSPGRRLRLLSLTLDPGDPTVQRTLGLLQSPPEGMPPHTWQACTPEALPAPEPGVADVLHVLCHGAQVAALHAVATAQGPRSTGWLGEAIGARAGGLHAVVLDICGAGTADRRQVGVLATRLVHAGVALCVAPNRTMDGEALAHFGHGFHDQLGAGATLAQALLAGWSGVHARQDPHPSGRWASISAWVGAPERLGRHVAVQRGWSPHGWPVVGPELADVLAAAAREAQADGFVGLEHVVRVLAKGGRLAPLAGTEAAAWQRLAARMAQANVDLGVGPGAGGDVVPSPRLAVAPPLGCSLQGWWQSTVAAAPALRLAAELQDGPPVDPLLAPTAASQWRPTATQGSERPSVLEIVGGPLCGRRVGLDSGAVVGRQLFAGSPRVDGRLGKRHLELRPDGTLHALRPVRVGAGLSQAAVTAGHSWTPAPGLVLRAGRTLLVAVAG